METEEMKQEDLLKGELAHLDYLKKEAEDTINSINSLLAETQLSSVEFSMTIEPSPEEANIFEGEKS